MKAVDAEREGCEERLSEDLGYASAEHSVDPGPAEGAERSR
jgi:hypothetical protein